MDRREIDDSLNEKILSKGSEVPDENLGVPSGDNKNSSKNGEILAKGSEVFHEKSEPKQPGNTRPRGNSNQKPVPKRGVWSGKSKSVDTSKSNSLNDMINKFKKDSGKNIAEYRKKSEFLPRSIREREKSLAARRKRRNSW